MRNIHMKEDLVKMFGHIVLNSAKETLLNNMGMFQIGAKSGHRASEHIFVMKSFMQMYEFYQKPLIICYWDYSVFFDSECLIDVMNEVYQCGVKGKVYRLLYRMNQS